MKSWLENNDIEMYLTSNEGKERFIRTLKTKIYKYMVSVSKNVYIDKLDEIVDEYNNTYYRTIKMKPVDNIIQHKYNTKIIHIFILVKKLMKKILNSKLVIVLEYQNIKIFLLKDMLQIGLKKFL